MSNIISFGEVCMESGSCDILLIQKKVKQAQMMIPTVRSISIENIQLKIHKIINTNYIYIYGCCMLPDGRTAFSENDETVEVFNADGSKDFEVKISRNPCDIVYISEDNTLAVTSGKSKKHCITIIDMKRKQIKKTISLDSNSYGIALKDNRLIYSAEDKGIRSVNLSDDSIIDVVREKMPSECYIATFMDNIYHTNNSSHAVTCYNIRGEIQWTFQNETVLKYPLGIDVDSDGNVYVVGGGSNNLVVISPDGHRHKEVLKRSDGLYYPISLCFSQTKNQMLVANFYDKKARLFNIV